MLCNETQKSCCEEYREALGGEMGLVVAKRLYFLRLFSVIFEYVVETNIALNIINKSWMDMPLNESHFNIINIFYY